MSSVGKPRPERRSQEQRRLETRARILSGTVRTVKTCGYANTTVARIAKEAKASIGAIQYHFAEKDDLMVAMLDHVFDELHRFLSGPEARSGDLSARVRVIVDRYWKGFSGPNYLVAWEIIASSKAHPLLHARVREHSAKATNSAFMLWRDVFADLGIADNDLFSILQMTLASLRGLAMLRWVDEDVSADMNYKFMLERMLETQLRQAATAAAVVRSSGQVTDGAP